MRGRTSHIFKHVKKDVDAIVAHNGTDPHLDNTFFYATGLINGLFEGCTAIVAPGRRTHVISSLLEETSARSGDARVTTFKTRDERLKVMKKALSGFERIGFNAEETTYHSYRLLKRATRARLIDVSGDLTRARLIKDASEIARIKKACDIASRAADMVPDILRPKMREYELAAELNHAMQRLGASGPSFTTIASFGPNSAEPHYTAGDAALKKGDFVLTDFGAFYKRYASDITRTCIYGRASREQREMYQLVLDAQQVALDEMMAGVDGSHVDAKVREFIDGTKYRGKFIHSTGHSIGLAVHDGGTISSNVKLKLEEGMVFTVEPGVYTPGHGGVRIEDNVVVRKGGVDVLTSAAKELVEV